MLEALIRAGHQVTALVRDNEKAARVAARGAHPVVGTLADPESYLPVAEAQDGYIHTAFDDANGPEIDRLTTEALLVLEGLEFQVQAGEASFARRPQPQGMLDAVVRSRGAPLFLANCRFQTPFRRFSTVREAVCPIRAFRLVWG